MSYPNIPQTHPLNTPIKKNISHLNSNVFISTIEENNNNNYNNYINPDPNHQLNIHYHNTINDALTRGYNNSTNELLLKKKKAIEINQYNLSNALVIIIRKKNAKL